MSTGKTHGLPIPPPAEPPSVSVEIVRVWATDGKLNMTVASDVWDDPAAWGIMLADLAGKIATSLAESKGLLRDQTLERLREGFDDEWQNMEVNG